MAYLGGRARRGSGCYDSLMAYASINGQRIYFEDSGGDGPAVVLAHGFLMDHTMFEHQRTALTPEFRLITWDERGFGLTETDGAPFSYWDSAADCVGLLDHLGLDSAIIGGMSQGGFLSLRVALSAPNRVRALVLLSTQAGVEDAEALAGFQGMIDTWVAVGPVDPLVEGVAALILNEPTENARWIAIWKERAARLGNGIMEQPGACLITRDDVTARLGEITCPAIVIHGADDHGIPIERAQQLAAGLSNCKGFVTVPNAAHAANLTHPNDVNPPLLSFLRSVVS